ncbi:glycosyltransferase [Aerococcus kribbianus]|uniref:Glycosyltransferase n=1 Tax=Aerococcus kribbianus TaxID=2999064 RepID=A0A9X3FMK4_9LACT|nr:MULTISPECIES: glycosyltransferase [unclassified Aerococcus]MCZ0717175.1 glycosyltransferase [Aerococcus sp. YH-aer221]MCZ0725463.1 glycosyltransferase [Aerococcus sp. YH-aer222]
MKLSVIVPIYNAENFLVRCIDSIISQSFQNLEIILINDGSSDGSGEICEKYAEADSRIKYIAQDNAGVSAARNEGLKIASGDYLTFVDSDDFIGENMYLKMLTVAKEHECDIVECGYLRNNISGEFAGNHLQDELIEDNERILLHYLRHENTTNYNCNKLYRKQIINNLQYEKLSFSEDYLFNVMTHSRAKKKKIISEDFYYYEDNPDSASNLEFKLNRIDGITAGEKALQEIKTQFPENEMLISLATKYVLEYILLFFDHFNFNNHIDTYNALLEKYRKMIRGIGLKNLFRVYSKKQVITRLAFAMHPQCRHSIIRIFK